MTDYREIIRLHSLKFSNVAIANSLCCSRNTVSEVLKLLKHILWNGLFRKLWLTEILGICFIQAGAIMREEDSLIMSMFTMNWPSPV